MSVRVIPVEVEKDDSSSECQISSEENNNPEEGNLSKSLEELSVQPKGYAAALKSKPSTSQTPTKPVESPVTSETIRKVQVKPAPKENQEFLKGFDVLEKRDVNAMSEYSLPNSDTLEKIILVIDRAQDENYTPFTVANQKYTPLCMVKRAINILIKLKLGINPHHEFAIIVMNKNDATLLLSFTNDLKKLTNCLNQISECETEDIFDLNTVFNILDNITLSTPLEQGLPPSYILRTIFFYGRSYTVPKITMSETLECFLKHPYFICDILMTHEDVDTSNHCQKIFNILQNLDQKGIGYFFPVSRDSRRLHKCAGKLLGHPLQRPIQKLIKN